MALAQTLWDSGLAKSLVQRQGSDFDLRRARAALLASSLGDPNVYWRNAVLKPLPNQLFFDVYHLATLSGEARGTPAPGALRRIRTSWRCGSG